MFDMCVNENIELLTHKPDAECLQGTYEYCKTVSHGNTLVRMLALVEHEYNSKYAGRMYFLKEVCHFVSLRILFDPLVD